MHLEDRDKLEVKFKDELRSKLKFDKPELNDYNKRMEIIYSEREKQVKEK